MNYQGKALEFLQEHRINIGDIIRIKKKNIEYQGILLDRAEDADDMHLVLKLDNGYNIGVYIKDSKLEHIEKGEKPEIRLSPLKIGVDPSKKDISIISTGGTVASIIDYKTGAVHPAFTAEDLLRANPELLEQANIKGRAVLNILSENMRPEYWLQTARSICDEINEGAYGVVVAHGTDTMHYTSAALSFMLETPVPVIITGAQRSSDRPSSDAFLNLMDSVTAAKADLAEVFVCMHASEDDTYSFLHRGSKVRKMHTSRRDTFRSINTRPLARIQNGNIIIDPHVKYRRRGDYKLRLYDSLEPKVAYIKSYPGIQSDILDYHLDKGYKGIVIEGTGLGHVPDDLIPTLHRAYEEKVPVIMTSQCIYGRLNMNVYSTGRKLISAGVISAQDMLPETAYVKLIWVLGQTDDIGEIKKLMQTNIAGEMEEKSSHTHFLN